MDSVNGEVFANALELLEPGDEQVAVLQENPIALLRSFLDELNCFGSLALAERKHSHLSIHLHLRGELTECLLRIRTLRQETR